MRITSPLLLAASFLFALAGAACGGDTGDQTDAGDNVDSGDTTEADIDAGDDGYNGSPSDTYPAFQIDAPQVLDVGDTVLAHPVVVPVYFGNDDTQFTGEITTFLGKFAASTFWPAAVGEYNVSTLTVTSPVQLTENAPAPTTQDSAIQTWLKGKLGSDPAFPAPTPNTIYALYYPSGTTISLGQNGGTSCSSFGAYHGNITYNSNRVAYAVMPRCATFAGLTGINAVTAPTSHELIEAATDPFGDTYATLDDDHITWGFILGGFEIGDMCAQTQTAFWNPSDIGNYVQSPWSNAKVKQAHDPCQPVNGTQAYFNAYPVLTDSINILNQVTTKGVTIPVGQSKTIEVDLFSDAPTAGPWKVDAIDSATLQQSAQELSFTWDRQTGQNGEKLHLTIKAVKASQYGASAFLLYSTLGVRESFWIGVVGN